MQQPSETVKSKDFATKPRPALFQFFYLLFVPKIVSNLDLLSELFHRYFFVGDDRHSFTVNLLSLLHSVLSIPAAAAFAATVGAATLLITKGLAALSVFRIATFSPIR